MYVTSVFFRNLWSDSYSGLWNAVVDKNPDKCRSLAAQDKTIYIMVRQCGDTARIKVNCNWI